MDQDFSIYKVYDKLTELKKIILNYYSKTENKPNEIDFYFLEHCKQDLVYLEKLFYNK